MVIFETCFKTVKTNDCVCRLKAADVEDHACLRQGSHIYEPDQQRSETTNEKVGNDDLKYTNHGSRSEESRENININTWNVVDVDKVQDENWNLNTICIGGQDDEASLSSKSQNINAIAESKASVVSILEMPNDTATASLMSTEDLQLGSSSESSNGYSVTCVKEQNALSTATHIKGEESTGADVNVRLHPHQSPNQLHQNLDKPFQCDICSKTFRSRQELTRHIRVHTGEKPFSCSVCKKQFTLLGNLKRHKFIHSEHKPFQCRFCSKGFTLKSRLMGHIASHTEENPFSCNICKKRFSKSVNLRKHELTHAGSKLGKLTFGDLFESNF